MFSWCILSQKFSPAYFISGKSLCTLETVHQNFEVKHAGNRPTRARAEATAATGGPGENEDMTKLGGAESRITMSGSFGYFLSAAAKLVAQIGLIVAVAPAAARERGFH